MSEISRTSNADPESSRPQCADAQLLRLLALDQEDLSVLSAHMQDALVRVGDMAFVPGSQVFALLAARFDWCACVEAGRCERARTGLHFDYVSRVSRSGFDQHDREVMLNVLSITFEAKDSPAGIVVVNFSAGAALRLEVECLEAHMRDLGDRWQARTTPAHPVEDPQ
jgi:hypothetical protein